MTPIDYAVLYAGLTYQQIEDSQKKETCTHGKPRGECGSSQCVVWTIDELNADEADESKHIDPAAIPFPV